MANILITGGTGFLGWEIVKQLLIDREDKIYLLVRNKSNQYPVGRVDLLLQRSFSHSVYLRFKKRIDVIQGDIEENNLGIINSNIKELAKKINVIYHCAALCEFNTPLSLVRKINVGGTRNILNFALLCKENNSLDYVSHISTISVFGKSGGTLYENSLNIKQEFNNYYEQTKFEAENILHKFRQRGLFINIFRPSSISGHSKTGEISSIQMLSQMLYILSLEIFSELPGKRNLQYNLVPVDSVAKATNLISFNNQEAYNYHLTNNNNVTLGFFLDTASDFFGFKKPKLIPQEEFNFLCLQGFRRRILMPFLSYFNHKETVFDTTNFQKAVTGTEFTWPVVDEKLLFKLFSYCNRRRFIKRKRI